MGAQSVIKSTDMPEDMQQDALDSAIKAIEMHKIEKDIAAFIKKDFDSRCGTTWHCIVGKNFGSYVSHEMMTFIYFYVGELAVLLFKCG